MNPKSSRSISRKKDRGAISCVRIFIGVIALTLFCSAAVQQIITTRTLNIRTGPELQARVISQTAAGTVFTVIARSGDWYQIEYAPGAQGWLYAPFTKALSAKTGWVILEAVQNAKLRLGPGREFPVIREIESGLPLLQTKARHDWFQVFSPPDQLLWIERGKVKAIGTSPRPRHTLIVKTRANLRMESGTDRDIIGQLEPGTLLLLLAKQGNWNWVFAEPDITGFVHDIVISPLLAETQPVPSSRLAKTGNLRTRPSTDAEIVATLPLGSEIFLLRKTGDWFEGVAPAYGHCWIHRVLLDELALPPISPAAVTLLDSSLYAINELELADFYRSIGEHRAALSSYIASIRIFDSLPGSLDSNRCNDWYLARALYALAQDLSTISDPYIQKATDLLQGIREKQTCYSESQESQQRWRKAVSIRADLLHRVSGQSDESDQTLELLEGRYHWFPICVEAELKRLTGRFYSQQQAYETAIQWQQESLAIYRALSDLDFDMQRVTRENHFRVMIELARNYSRLGRHSESMAVMDELRPLVERENRADWQESYNRTVRKIIDQLH